METVAMVLYQCACDEKFVVAHFALEGTSVTVVWRKDRHRCYCQTLREREISMAIGSGGLFLDWRECVDRQSCQGEDW